ncbi:MarR family winged helix-turn-helix transcriptional regulator [Streptomyces sp. NBC_00201]|uniref:MarR family winged helix-turn-helix transcriptional regulator n=1 Tax=unclassified Streptomyces TaxID=2593676 RepID=UPI00225A2272|nr:MULTISPECIES: MarR family winged helix-turn-helix transcriptional regulator [unclassified Streptomyces]MCX5060197.1 MarR family winged helix-turn-helix transcriptional regulator [Streptomyces sp. NBC_00452]MCX5252025.1 MarR family winged helix-turn-helix transcriptional regulator [Streptomyces sp. NBC_00201]
MHGELQELGRAVKQAQYRQHRALDSALSAIGTTLAQWDALRAISRSPGASARELAAATFQTEQAFGTLVGRLTAQDLAERRPGRGRRIEHHLTPVGEQVLAAGHKVADEVLAACFSALPDADRATLLDLLQRLTAERDT